METSGIDLEGLLRSREIQIMQAHNIKVILFCIILDLYDQKRLSIHWYKGPKGISKDLEE